jgi:hypothetical protein
MRSWLVTFEIAFMLVRFDHVAGPLDTANVHIDGIDGDRSKPGR